MCLAAQAGWRSYCHTCCDKTCSVSVTLHKVRSSCQASHEQTHIQSPSNLSPNRHTRKLPPLVRAQAEQNTTTLSILLGRHTHKHSIWLLPNLLSSCPAANAALHHSMPQPSERERPTQHPAVLTLPTLPASPTSQLPYQQQHDTTSTPHKLSAPQHPPAASTASNRLLVPHKSAAASYYY